MSAILRKLIKKPLNKLGLDLVRYNPQYSLGPYAYLTTFGIKTVIDAGAHSGEFALMINKLLPEAAIYSFEPQPDIFRQLEENMRSIARFRAFNYALGDANQKLEMHRSDFTMSSSLLKMADLHKESFPETAGESIEVIEVRPLDELLAGLELELEILVKIDVQGYEDKVIAGGADVISKARAMIIEVSFQELYEGQPLFDDVYALLKEKGFDFMGHLFQLTSPINGSVLQADALFLRR